MNESTNSVTADQIAAENWEPHMQFPENECECTRGHKFMSRAKFSGALIELISHKPCPTCGTHSLRVARSTVETMNLTSGDINA